VNGNYKEVRDKTAHPHIKGMETPIESATIADSVAKVYGVKKADILNTNSRRGGIRRRSKFISLSVDN